MGSSLAGLSKKYIVGKEALDMEMSRRTFEIGKGLLESMAEDLSVAGPLKGTNIVKVGGGRPKDERRALEAETTEL